VPELPEVERARSLIAEAALDRRIVAVDDADEYVCRPHVPGEVASAVLGRTLTHAHRRGKAMWCETSPRPGALPDAAGPMLGLHLGMAGRIVVTGPDGREREGGDPHPRGRTPNPLWERFTLRFADGGSLVLLDPRRLGRVRLDPDLDGLGPDALGLTPKRFRELVPVGAAPIKARLLDQSVIAGVGNLLADETLWQARLHPGRPARELEADEVKRLHAALRRSLGAAIRKGGVHTGAVIGSRVEGARCPRCGGEMRRAVVGGRTTWWCAEEQR
jgi:formamidopyrimidine-DNA glycosylase